MKLAEYNRTVLTMEALVTKEQFKHLFTEEELNVAYDRLKQYEIVK
ncbi:hypothetical protein IM538_07515 [Cytobacillus suaedae]|nr:hypothetical protein IM538_07515 [Cytobacillus suaedae]